jgi:hypothetical protein
MAYLNFWVYLDSEVMGKQSNLQGKQRLFAHLFSAGDPFPDSSLLQERAHG